MDLNKFTYSVQEILNRAIEFLREKKNPELTVWHLLYALVDDVQGIIFDVFNNLEVDREQLLQRISLEVEKLPKVSRTDFNSLVSPRLQNVLSSAGNLAYSWGDKYIAKEHLLLSLLKEKEVKDLLRDCKIDYEVLEDVVMKTRGNQKIVDPFSEAKYNILKKYTVSFTQQAREGKLDPVIGRDQEIIRVIQVLSRRVKNNPVLLGDPGVGKTAIVEGLAQRIIAGDVPDTLKKKELLSLDLAALLAGAKFRGEFEERLKSILLEIEKDPQKYIIFLDELHTLVGAGAAEGAIDASNMLKPALARGVLHAIGATTVREYRQYIEKDAALERRFQPVYVEEPSVIDTIAILRGLKEKYEVHHGIRITDEALVAAANLSKRYITDRFLPDKAIDLIDEAAAAVKIQTESSPYKLDSLRRKIVQIEIELAALKKEKDEKAQQTRKELERQLVEYKEKERELSFIWQEQKMIVQLLQEKRNELDKLRVELENYERNVELEKAAEIKYGKIPQIEKEIKELERKWEKIPEAKKLFRQEVIQEDVAVVVSRWTGIPVNRLFETEAEKLLNLEKKLQKRVVGQDEALKVIAKAVRRSRAGIAEGRKPIGVFLFLGPTGVGKTETAKALAEILFNSEEALIRIDMTEYQEEHTIARLIGAPPGYIGFEEGGQLTEAVRRKPYSVILLDEIEKANSSIFNLFLQIFDEGRLTDGRGRLVDFKNTIIIATSNLGTEIIQKFEDQPQILQEKIWEVLRSKFRPEFLNRIDQIVIFNSLNNKKVVEKIVDLQLQDFAKRLAKKEISIDFTSSLRNYLATIGFDKNFGARPLKRVIMEKIEDEIALLIIEGKLGRGDKITVDFKDGKVSFITK